MQEFIGSVRKSLIFKPPGEETAGFGGFVERIGSSIRKSRIGIFAKTPMQTLPQVDTTFRGGGKPLMPLEEENLPPMEGVTEDEPLRVLDKDDTVLASKTVKYEASKNEVDNSPPPIRWRKGELIGCGAFGRVHMGMNLDSGELLAVKEVSIAAKGASNKTQEYIMELEKEVNLLKNLSHPNIVRYLGIAREVDSLNILLEFVPGGSISSLLGKFGFFPESVIRMYTKQLLLGLEYLHTNKIMHRDIKGANILVDNKGCIKLADFGASKKVEALATITCAKSMKGTPYWMAPEVIVQSGHSYSADIWSVGCTVIEMATGKAPWSQQYQEYAALFYVGTTKSHPPIPDHLSNEARDFLLKCLQKEPELRPTASELLKHPFVTGEIQEHSTHMGSCGKQIPRNCGNDRKDNDALVATKSPTDYSAPRSNQELSWQSVKFDDDMCRIDDADDLVIGSFTKMTDNSLPFDCNHSFNPVSDPDDDKICKFDGSPVLTESTADFSCNQNLEPRTGSLVSLQIGYGSALERGTSAPEEDDEETEAKIRAFLEDKASELKKLQTPLYDFYKSLNVVGSPTPLGDSNPENVLGSCNLPPKSRSPNKVGSRRFSTAITAELNSSPGCCSRQIPNSDDVNFQASLESKEGLDHQHESHISSSRLSEIQRKWKEELAEELERTRERMRQACAAKGSSPKDRICHRQTEKKRFASPAK